MLNLNQTRKSVGKNALFVIAFSSLLSACSPTLTINKNTLKLDSTSRWIMLPIQNFSNKPQAGRQAESLLEAHLQTTQRLQIAHYPQAEKNNLSLLLNDRLQLKQAKAWAQNQQYDYGLSGSINEWHYKNGLDGEPVVALSLKIIDLKSGQTIWMASGSNTGWHHNNLSSTANTLLADLLKPLKWQQSQKVTQR